MTLHTPLHASPLSIPRHAPEPATPRPFVCHATPPRMRHALSLPLLTQWFEGVPEELYLSRRYSTAHNKHGVKSGLDQVRVMVRVRGRIRTLTLTLTLT